MITLRIDKDLIDELTKLERRLAQTPAKKAKRVMRQVGQKTIKFSQARTRKQTDVHGRAFEPHKAGRKRKMLTRLARRLRIIESDTKSTLIGFKNSVEGKIGAKQQFGFKETSTREISPKVKSEKQIESDKAPASRRQARALLKAGYKARKANGRGYRMPTIKWITSNLKSGQAGLILWLLKGQTEFWETVLPPRSFLGLSASEQQEIVQFVLQEMHDALNFEEKKIARFGF